jgi:hypothetical protein
MRLKLLKSHLHIYVYCDTIHNSQALETANMPHKWFKKMWYLYTVEFYLATVSEILLFSSKCMELESILRAVSQAQRAQNHMFSLICGL